MHNRFLPTWLQNKKASKQSALKSLVRKFLMLDFIAHLIGAALGGTLLVIAVFAIRSFGG